MIQGRSVTSRKWLNFTMLQTTPTFINTPAFINTPTFILLLIDWYSRISARCIYYTRLWSSHVFTVHNFYDHAYKQWGYISRSSPCYATPLNDSFYQQRIIMTGLTLGFILKNTQTFDFKFRSYFCIVLWLIGERDRTIAL